MEALLPNEKALHCEYIENTSKIANIQDNLDEEKQNKERIRKVLKIVEEKRHKKANEKALERGKKCNQSQLKNMKEQIPMLEEKLQKLERKKENLLHLLKDGEIVGFVQERNGL